uniref:Uncharacterized protein n=1 Tax=Micrurus lemniscatus lemniscatus TaxID=129467 RepID=A0A2D4I0B4_MICLE
MFLNQIKKQWESPGVYTRPSGSESTLFNVDKDLLGIMEVPKVDGPVVALASSSVIPPDAEDFLKAEDRKEEMALRRAHQADAWAIRASTTAFFLPGLLCSG